MAGGGRYPLQRALCVANTLWRNAARWNGLRTTQITLGRGSIAPMRFYGGCGAHGAPSNYIMLLPNGLWTPSPGGLDLNNGIGRLDIAGSAPGEKLYRINATIAHLYLVNIRMGLVKLRGQGALGELSRQPPLPKQCAQATITHRVLCPCAHNKTTVSCSQFAPALGASRRLHKLTNAAKSVKGKE